MTAEIREEMLSAYLDGELSAEDRARVEAWLADSADARHLLDELRAVRSGMKSLPRNQLAADLGPAVLQRAERAVPDPSRQPSVMEKIAPSSVVRDWWLRGGWRRWAWPVAAIAAALLIALFDTERKPAERQVAQTRAPQGETFIEARPQAETPADAKSQDAFLVESDKEKGPPESTPDGAAKPKLAKREYGPATEPPMPPDKMAGGAPAAAAAPSNALERKAGTPAQALKQSATDSLDDTLVVIDVTPAYARERGFEKLLASNKIAYRRGDQRPLQKTDASVRDESENLAIKRPDEEPYEVDATPEQVEQIITLLRQDVSRVGRIAKDQSAAGTGARVQQQADKNAPVANSQAQSQANQRARTQFLLRVVDPLPAQKARN